MKRNQRIYLLTASLGCAAVIGVLCLINRIQPAADPLEVNANLQQPMNAGSMPLESKPDLTRVVESSHTPTRQLFLAEQIAPLRRFSELSERARQGDPEAKYFRSQMAFDCKVGITARADRTIVDNARASDKAQVNDALERLSRGCDDVINSPDYAEFTENNKGIPRDDFDADIARKLKEAFANNGLASLKQATAEALASRPDETTANTIISTYQEMNLLDTLVPPSNSGTLLPKQRYQFLVFAMNLWTCDFGRNCGPGSNAVAMYCVSLGACRSGADLRQLYASRLLAGSDYDNVVSMLEFFRSFSGR